MVTVISKDGTRIAYNKKGSGPALIVVGGALSSSELPYTELLDHLSEHFTVYNYDRRGRGQSGDTAPYSVEREIEDLEALIDQAGGSVLLYGHSSGAALSLETALKLGNKIKKLVLYEVPYASDEKALEAWIDYGKKLSGLLAKKQHADAVALFMKLTGMPDEQLEHMRQAPFWHIFESVAPTLAYDYAVVGEDGIPTERASHITMPTLILYGKDSFPFMASVAKTLHKVIPDSQLDALEGQTHNPLPQVLVPVLQKFFS
jgi:pimeloyl-ACP methyl ester carboxylesterase